MCRSNKYVLFVHLLYVQKKQAANIELWQLIASLCQWLFNAHKTILQRDFIGKKFFFSLSQRIQFGASLLKSNVHVHGFEFRRCQ